jgi:hypothetical protein
MLFDEQLHAQTLKAIQEKLPLARCSLCGQQKLTLLYGFVETTLLPNFPYSVFAGGQKSILLQAVMACDNCGNTYYLDLFRLGVLKTIR